MRKRSSQAEDLEHLKQIEDARRRGYALQPFVGSLFQGAHFEVTHSPGAGGTRQVDLIARQGDESYLIETKWWTKKVSSAEIASFEDRLNKTPASVVGLFVSYSGFTADAIARVESNAERPMLLVTGAELEMAVAWRGDFVAMLRQKREQMLVHAKAITMSERRRRRTNRRKPPLPDAGETFILLEGDSPRPWMRSGGSFGQFAFVRELPDIDWVPGGGHGVTLDVTTSVGDERELMAMLGDLAALNWLTDEASWSIQQATVNWHGVGAAAFAELLQDWRGRYEGVHDVHHTEEFCYIDKCDDIGFYSLTGQVAAHERRIVWRASLSFQLSGIPIDASPLRHLCDKVGGVGTRFFRPRDDKSVSRHHVNIEDAAIIDVVGFVGADVGLATHDNDHDWAVGVVVRNPFQHRHGEVPEWWPDMLRDSEFVIAALRSWHPMNQPKTTYRIWGSETAWTSDALLIRLIVDWDNDEVVGDVPPKLAIATDGGVPTPTLIARRSHDRGQGRRSRRGGPLTEPPRETPSTESCRPVAHGCRSA
ncbi:MAG: restriction endonuclease [Acidimicrobiales bacterium]